MSDSKNMYIGFALIGVVLFVFSWLNQPSQEELKRISEYRDSIQKVNEAKKAQEEAAALALAKANQLFEEGDSDSTKMIKAYNKAGEFYQGLIGSEETVTLKNNKVTVVLSSKGAMAKSVVLSEFKNYKEQNVTLFDKDDASVDFVLPVKGKGEFNTADLYFKIKSATDTSVVFALPAGNGALEFAYNLRHDDYMLDFSIDASSVQNLLDVRGGNIEAVWKAKIKQQEKGRKFENRYAALNYKIYDDDVEELDGMSYDSVEEEECVKWVAFKDQFFSSVFIANGKFTSANMVSNVAESPYLKSYEAVMKVPYEQSMNFSYYFGPNKYSLLKSYDKGKSGAEELDLHHLVPLGWGIFRWVNQLIVIPLFNFFGSFISSYGIIILLLTIVIKLILFPFTYKSYLSTAKMRVLKPQIEEINKSIPEDRPTERQQAMFALYNKAGVNPMGGCLPMLLQMPVLIAMFSFFPASIELRQQSFLWAADLSTYDAIVSWDMYIPFVSDYFGNHVSLFCLLMTITNLIYTKVNMSMTDTGAQQQMPMMKYMMYFMPVMFLFIFNDYASGLSYYYLLSLLITIVQTYGMRYFIDEEKLLIRLKENQSKPSKRSAWMERLEAEMKRQQELQKQQSQRR